MKKLLSIVIPTYNMEELLPRCVESLIVEDEALLSTLEVIIVNDGSKDKSVEIAKEYAAKYPSVVNVIDKENGNYGSCINAALRVATGEYFRILDADDYFSTDALTNLLTKISVMSELPDVIITNHREVYANGGSKEHHNDKYEYDRLYKTTDIPFLKNENDLLVMHRLTYRLCVLKECKLQHTERISYTDSEYSFYPWQSVKTFMFVEECLYNYYIGRAGQTVSMSSYMKNVHQLYVIIDRMLSYFETADISSFARKTQLEALYPVVFVYYRVLLSQDFEHNEDLKTMDARLQKLDTDFFNKTGKISYLKIFPVVWVWRHFHKPMNHNPWKWLYSIVNR